MVTDSESAQFGYNLKFLITCYRQRDSTLGVFFRIIRVSKNKIILNFDLDLHFQGHLLQESDDQIQCNHFGENFMKIG